MASAALTRDRVLHYLARQVKFYSLSFHVIDIKRLFQCNNFYIILTGVLLSNRWARQLHKYLKHDGREPIPIYLFICFKLLEHSKYLIDFPNFLNC